MDPQGHVFVADYTAGYIKVFDNHSTVADLLEICNGTNPLLVGRPRDDLRHPKALVLSYWRRLLTNAQPLSAVPGRSPMK